MDKDKNILGLIAKVDSLMKRVQQLEHFEVENKKLRIENTDLKHRLSKYEHPKNSNNSSIPPRYRTIVSCGLQKAAIINFIIRKEHILYVLQS